MLLLPSYGYVAWQLTQKQHACIDAIDSLRLSLHT